MRAMPRNSNARWRRLLLAALASIPFAHACAQSSPPAELKLSVAVGPSLPLGKAAERWSALVNDASQRRIVTKLHAGATLAERDPARELLALKEGRADLAVGSSLQWSMQLPALAVYSLPWLAPSTQALAALVADAALVTALATRLEGAGVTLVAMAPLGFREIATSRRSIRAPADVAGLKLRAIASPLVHDLLLALGAQPQAMPFTQAQAAFTKGELDGQEGLPSALAAARAPASGQKHLTDWGAIAEVMLFAVRKPVWEGWSDADREAVRGAALRAIAETDAISHEAEAMRRLSRSGMSIVRITPAGHRAFRSAVADVDRRWRASIGDEVVLLAEQALANVPSAAKIGRP
jgi:TRAP-type C4-dicarboxylate transport system substrate-binding protein